MDGYVYLSIGMSSISLLSSILQQVKYSECCGFKMKTRVVNKDTTEGRRSSPETPDNTTPLLINREPVW